MKSRDELGLRLAVKSPPTRAEWSAMVSRADADSRPLRSPPTRAEWIEIVLLITLLWVLLVSAHTGGVD